MPLRLGGWHRLGIAFSVLWLVGCTVYLGFALHDMSVQAVEAVYETKDLQIWAVGQSDKFVDCELAGSERPPPDTTSIEQRMSCRPLLAPVAWLYGLPLAMLWTVVPVTALALRWIVTGFRR